jgi:hypothetical protein
MIKIIETNLSMDGDIIKDHQSRVIEVESWDEYLDEIKEYKCVSRLDMFYNLNGCTLPKNCRIDKLVYDDFHLSCDVYSFYNNMKTKKLAYKAEERRNNQL